MEALQDTGAKETWIAAMVRLLEGEEYFRWHDSGDVQSLAHLNMIADVAEQTPWVKHWLPTREFNYVRQFLKTRARPTNLVIRMSAQMMGASAPAGFPHTSTVHTKNSVAEGHDCPARFQDNECRACRACWDSTIENVSYPQH
jgi:hypothetical protein